MTRKGFTLVEILIVVIILGILAAVVIPQFTEASNDARAAALDSDLQTVRSQIELWKIQHLDALPGNVNGVSMQDQLTGKTDQDGTLNANGAFGPYLQQFPTNPYTGTNTVGAAAAAGQGWIYDPATGDFSADNTP